MNRWAYGIAAGSLACALAVAGYSISGTHATKGDPSPVHVTELPPLPAHPVKNSTSASRRGGVSIAPYPSVPQSSTRSRVSSAGIETDARRAAADRIASLPNHRRSESRRSRHSFSHKRSRDRVRLARRSAHGDSGSSGRAPGTWERIESDVRRLTDTVPSEGWERIEIHRTTRYRSHRTESRGDGNDGGDDAGDGDSND